MKRKVKDVAVLIAEAALLLAGVAVLTLALGGVIIWFTPPPARCAVTLPSGETVTRYGCRAGSRGSGVLYCAEVDYAPAAWVTVTCDAAPVTD